MALMIEAHGMVAKSFESARAYREHMPDEAVACLIIDTKLPDADGLDLQQTLSGESAPPPIIFVSDTGDIRYTVRAIKRGAVDFLPKPVDRMHWWPPSILPSRRVRVHANATREPPCSPDAINSCHAGNGRFFRSSSRGCETNRRLGIWGSPR
jgi:DNA-binding NarL/FixJ family response regulator